MSITPKKMYFFLRCPKCRRKLKASFIKDAIAECFAMGESFEYNCRHCSHDFVASCNVRVVAKNKPLDKQ